MRMPLQVGLAGALLAASAALPLGAQDAGDQPAAATGRTGEAELAALLRFGRSAATGGDPVTALQALQAFQAALDLAQRAGDPFAIAAVHGELGRLQFLFKDYQQAATHWGEARRLLDTAVGDEGHKGARLLEAHIELARCELMVGRTHRALRDARAATALARDCGSAMARAEAWAALGRTHLQLQQWVDALRCFRRAGDEVSGVPGAAQLRAGCAGNVAGLLFDLGDRDAALAVLDDLLRPGGDTGASPSGRWLAHCQRAMLHFGGDWAAARTDLEAAEAVLSSISEADDAPRTLVTRTCRAVVEGATGRRQAAAAIAASVEVEVQQSGCEDRPISLWVRRLLVEVRLASARHLGDRAALVGCRGELMALREVCPRFAPGEAVRVDALLGRLLLDDFDDPVAAEPVLAAAVAAMSAAAAASTALDESSRWSMVGHWRDYVDPFADLLRCRVRLGRADAALAALEAARARALADLLQRSAFDPVAVALQRAEQLGDDDRAEALRQLPDRFDEATAAIAAARRATTAAADAALPAAQARLQALYAERAELVRDVVEPAAVVDVARIRSGLTAGEALLAYALGDRASFAGLVDGPGGEIAWFALVDDQGKPLTAAAVADAVDGVLQPMPAAAAAAPARGRPLRASAAAARARAAAHRLFRWLLPAPLWQQLRGRPRVYLLPHGALNRLPFELLVTAPASDTAPTRYWLDDGPPLAVQESGAVLVFSLQRRLLQRRQRAPFAAVVVAATGDGSLPGVAAEGEAVAAALRGRALRCGAGAGAVRLLAGDEATESATRRLAPTATVLHIAGHQAPPPAWGHRAGGIALHAPAEPTADDDGVLDLDDLLLRWQGALPRCELAVLSTCGSRTGWLSRDEGFLALPLGLRFAGCPAVVASQWPVDDAVAAALMTDFYARLTDDAAGEDHLAAFTAARRALKQRHPDPAHWAAFVWIGAPR